MVSSAFFTTFLFPLIGTIISNCLYLTPLPVVLEARYTRYLGPTNPYPFVLIAFSSMGWTIYGCLKQDYFLFISAFPGVVLGLYYTIVCLTVIAKRSADSDFSEMYVGVEAFLLFAVSFWGIMGFVAAVNFKNYPNPLLEASSMVGLLCCSLSVAYYASPLTTLYQVIKERDSSTFYLPLLCINLTSSSMWFLYGLAGTHDPNLIIPNSIGMTLSLIQITLRLTIPAKEKAQTQTFEHILHLIQGKVPPSFVTSEKVLLSRKYSFVSIGQHQLSQKRSVKNILLGTSTSRRTRTMDDIEEAEQAEEVLIGDLKDLPL